MDDNKVINIVAQLAPILNNPDYVHNVDRCPFEVTIELDGYSSQISMVRIAKSNKHISGISSKICQIESRLRNELSYSKLINLTHELSLEDKWIDKSSLGDKAPSCADDCLMPFNSLVEKVFENVLKVSIFKLTQSNDIIQRYKCAGDNNVNNAGGVADNKIHQNLLKPLCLVDCLTNECFYSIYLGRSDEVVRFTLWDAAVFSYDFLINDTDKLLFVLYQLLSALNYCGTFGYLPSDLRLQAVYVDKIYWAKLDLAQCLAQTGENLSHDFIPVGNLPSPDVSLEENVCAEQKRRDRRPLWEWSRLWVSGRMSNFDYLSVLNRFAGRRRNDPYYHPVFPWVVDFTQPNAGYRDLSKTKYRLTKGDLQLDQTYCVSPDTSKSHVPHHVSEFLSDIGYFTYKARVISKDTLCKHVRSKWVPEEYPSSVRRIYNWTPDECIPEFYNDSSIFQSIHDDLPDLEHPNWCKDYADFIDWHRKMLESDSVSSKLHQWIDLVFGYKLSGVAAVEAKNVQYHMSNYHQELRNYGIVQLFDSPHPARLSQVKPFHWQSLFSKKFDQLLNPLYEFETLQQNSLNATDIKPNDELNISEIWKKICKDQKVMKSQPSVDNCMKSLAIVLIELCNPQTMFHLPRTASLSERWILAEQTFQYKTSIFPRCLKSILKYLFGTVVDDSSNDNTGCPVESSLITPGFLIQPVAQLVPFPFYTSILHDCLCKISESEDQFQRMQISCNLSLSVNLEAMRSLKEVKVRLLAKILPLILPQLAPAGVELVSRLVLRLLCDPWTSVVTAWTFFNPIAEALGPSMTLKQYAVPLVDLYDVDTPCTSKCLKLYHRTFLLQILVRIGTKEFLDHFVLPLIEAVGGERDKLCLEEDAYSRHLIGRQLFLASGFSRRGRKDSRLKREDTSSSDIRNSQCASGTLIKQTESLDLLRPVSVDSLSPKLATITHVPSSENIQFDLDISDDGTGIQFGGAGKTLAVEDSASILSSSSFSSQQNLQSECEDDESECSATVPVVSSNSNFPTVSEVAQESLMWLTHRLGPLLTSKHVTRNLLRMLALCYYGDEEKLSHCVINEVENVHASPLFPCHVTGDSSARRILICLEHVAAVFGEQFILRHYFAHCVDIVQLASKRLNPSVECGLIGCIMVVRHMFPFLSDERLMDNLKDHYFVDNILYPLVRLISSLRLCFSSSRSRTVLAWKLIDCLYCMGVRTGGENVKSYLFVVFQRLMCTYDVLYELNDGGMVLGRTSGDGSGNGDDNVIEQLKEIFTPELASLCINSFKLLIGRQYLQLSLPNSELVLKVSELHRIKDFRKDLIGSLSALDSAAIGAKTLSGNRLAGADPNTPSSPQMHRRTSDVYSKRLKNSVRQIRGNWLAYWEHELGRSDRDASFNFKQMKLITFVGHTAQVRRFHVLENENSFISASQDKTVKLWSLRSFGDGSCRTCCQFTYKSHSKPLYDLTFLESLRLVASTDGKIQIWDPFFGSILREFDFGDSDQHIITVTKALAPSSKLILAAGTSSTIKFLDVRQAKWTQEYKLGAHAFGPVRGICVDPNGHWIACGHGIGQLTVLDIRTGQFLATRKIADVDINLMECTQKGSVVVSLPEQNLLVWKMPHCTFANKLIGPNETLQCMTSYNNELLCCTQTNRLRIHSSTDSDAIFSESKLRSDIFTGTVSSMAVLPLNKLLLLGSSNGSVELLC